MNTIFEQTGWTRRHPAELCPFEHLGKITEYDFDLRNTAFGEYVVGRTGNTFRSDLPIDTLIQILQTWSDNRFLTDSLLAESVSGYVFTPEDRADQLRVHHLQKARIQDCWELFNHVEPAKYGASDTPEKGRIRPTWEAENDRHASESVSAFVFDGHCVLRMNIIPLIEGLENVELEPVQNPPKRTRAPKKTVGQRRNRAV